MSEGVIIIGRNNCDEFAMGSSSESSVYGATKNGRNETDVWQQRHANDGWRSQIIYVYFRQFVESKIKIYETQTIIYLIELDNYNCTFNA